jgi:hypothetical protein
MSRCGEREDGGEGDDDGLEAIDAGFHGISGIVSWFAALLERQKNQYVIK